ncbi:MAG: aminotransferase class IV [Deltaproteobacteria bacterium]|nr:aminotransferase class IV [Deltaproteobacteria bacterium]
MATQILFYNGKWYPSDARPEFLNFEFFVYQHALHYASAAFEGMRCYPNFAKKDGTLNLIGVDIRIDRLFRSMEYACLKLPPNPSRTWEEFSKGFPKLAEKYKTVLKGKIDRKAVVEFPYTKGQVKEFILKTILLNLESGFLNPDDGCYVRPVSFRGVTKDRHLGVFSLGHSVDFLLSVKPWGKYLGTEAFEKGAPVIVAEEGSEEYNRQHKLACNYLSGQRLVNFASFNHFNEILLTDATPERNVLEGSGENLLFYCGGNKFVSPRQENKPILPGTTLKTVDQIIRLLGGEITYRDIPLKEIMDGKFLGAAMTGTAAEVTPISLVFDPKTKKAVEIPVATEIKQLQKTYLDLVHGLEVDTCLKPLQQNLILEIKWNEKEKL